MEKDRKKDEEFKELSENPLFDKNLLKMKKYIDKFEKDNIVKKEIMQ